MVEDVAVQAADERWALGSRFVATIQVEKPTDATTVCPFPSLKCWSLQSLRLSLEITIMSFLKKWASSPQVSTTSVARCPEKFFPDGPERGLPLLPNELIPTILIRLDSRSLYHLAQVCRRFNELSTRGWLARHGVTPSQLSSGRVVIKSELPIEAFAALRSALFLRGRPLTGLTCIFTSIPAVDSKTLQQLESLIMWFSPPLVRIEATDIDFGVDLIAQAAAVKPTSRALTKLVCTISGDAPTTVFILKDGLFTCRPETLRRWTPATGQYEGGWTKGWSESSFSSIRMHDGSRQRVPTIRSMQTLGIKYPMHDTVSPFNQWKIVTIDAASITDLQLTIKLSSQEWSAILAAISLPSLVCNHQIYVAHRHAAAPGCPPLHLPRLESLNTLAPYLTRILQAPDSAQHLPRLTHIELRQHYLFRDALLLASTHAPLAALTIWSLHEFDAPWWPRFPGVRRITLNEIRVPASLAHLPALLVRAFPALKTVEVNYSFVSEEMSRRQIAADQAEFVHRVSRVNPTVHTFLFDGREHALQATSV
ncbi:hypothetical protein B0H10DRAFT_1961417 [Mycena sp. CBHHK59/15]|nr:hypothetical protein B0H10DRAFT_1961417 [Mycena sp. CBHHK59/15]